MQNITDEQLIQIFKDAKKIVVVGASNKPNRASNAIMKFLMKNGYDVTPPVNPPIEKEVLGIPTYDTVEELPPFEPDIVDVFRQSAFAPEIVRAAIGKKKPNLSGCRKVWNLRNLPKWLMFPKHLTSKTNAYLKSIAG